MIDQKWGFQWSLGERGDSYILNESSYACLFPPKNKTSLCPEDTWLDVGAHFGSFSIRASQHVRNVVAVEPSPGNLERLTQNIDLNNIKNIEVIPAAIVAGPAREVNLALGHTFDYTHRVGYIRGRKNLSVQGVNINDMILTYSVNKIKMDCEGSEAEILEDLLYEPIEEIILEWHFTLIPDHDWSKLRSALRRLEDNGFAILRAPTGEVTKRWTAIIWAKKPLMGET